MHVPRWSKIPRNKYSAKNTLRSRRALINNSVYFFLFFSPHLTTYLSTSTQIKVFHFDHLYDWTMQPTIILTFNHFSKQLLSPSSLFRKKSHPPTNLAPRNGTTKYKQPTFHTAFRIRLSSIVRKMGFRNLTLSFRRSLSYLGS